jgi:hypothetical protein
MISCKYGKSMGVSRNHMTALTKNARLSDMICVAGLRRYGSPPVPACRGLEAKAARNEPGLAADAAGDEGECDD